MSDANDAMMELLQQQIVLNTHVLEASKAEAEICERKAAECKLNRDAVEKQTAELQRQNAMTQEILELLRKNIHERPVEHAMERMENRIDALVESVGDVLIISQLTGRELLRQLSKQENSVQDKKMLFDALGKIGASKNAIDLSGLGGTKIGNVSSGRDTNIEES